MYHQPLLQGFTLPDNVKASTDLNAVAQHGELILMVIPTPFVDKVMAPLGNNIRDDQVRSSCL